MPISVDGGRNPSAITYNDINVNEVWYNDEYVWPFQRITADGVYWRVVGDGHRKVLYLRGDSKDGYAKWVGGGKIGTWGVYRVVNETNIVLPSDSTSMMNCVTYTAMVNVDVSEWDVSNVTNFSAMLSPVVPWGSTTANNTIIVKGLDTWRFKNESGLNMNSLFNESILANPDEIKDWDVHNVTNMTWMFAHNRGKNDIDISRWHIPSTCSTQEMFFNSAFSSINASNNYFTSLNALFESSAASTIRIDNITLGSNNMIRAFKDCPLLESLDLSPISNLSWTSTREAFMNCYSLENIYVNNNLIVAGDSTDMFRDCQKLPNYDGVTFDASKAVLSTQGGYLTKK